MRTISQSLKALGSIPAQPGVHRLARHPIALGDFYDRCAVVYLFDGLIPLLDQLHQHERECQASTEANLSSIKRS